MVNIVLVAHNIRSAHNVGSLLRTADGLGVSSIYLTGYTPYPHLPGDKRLPHLANKLNAQIAKTALGAEKVLRIHHSSDVLSVIGKLKSLKFKIVALEQTAQSVSLVDFNPTQKIALIVGNEVEGLDSSIVKAVDLCLQIPMLGVKESFNVSVASAIALYNIRFS